MNRNRYPKLLRIDNNHRITLDSDFAFLYMLQGSLLLSLQSREILNAVQYRYASEKLQRQRLDRAKNLQQKEAGK